MSTHAGDPSGPGDGSGNGSRRRRRRRGRAQEEEAAPSGGGVWPEPFVEALALQVAVDASRAGGRLSAAPALAVVFQVCSTWRAVSRSDLLWQNLTQQAWNRTHLVHATWHDEFVFWHRTANNFRRRRAAHTTLHFSDADTSGGAALLCLRLAISDDHLAAGYSDGSVRLFHLPTRLHVTTFRPPLRHGLGRYSPAVTGIILSSDTLIAASLSGDIHVSLIAAPAGPTRWAHVGDVVNDGALVDFTGCSRFWVGLFAGVPGRAIHIWDARTEELIFVGGSLTDPDSVNGWHMLNELTVEPVGRVRVNRSGLAVACTGIRFIVFDLNNQGMILFDEEVPHGILVGATDVSNDVYVIVDRRGEARVRHVRTLEEVCRFNLRGASFQGALGCMNSMYVLMCVGVVLRVWDAENGEYLYSFRERIAEVTAVAASDRHVAVSGRDLVLHLWDYGS